MTLLNNISDTRTRAWPFLFGVVMLRAATVMAPLMLLWIVARRVVGGFAPLPGAALVLIGTLAASTAILWRIGWRTVEGESAWRTPALRYLPPACLALIVLAFSIRDTHPLGLLLFWITIVGEEVWYGWSSRRATAVVSDLPSPSPLATALAEEANDAPPSLLPGVSQQTTRSVDATGETLECFLRIAFAPGEQTQTAHVAFCPAVLHPPLATAEQLDGAPCEVKITAAEVYGARIEVKRRGGLILEDEVILCLRVSSREQP